MTESKLDYPEYIDYAGLSELIYRAQRYPEHLIVTTGVRDHQTGNYVSTVDKYGTTASIELAMRFGVEKGLNPLEAVFTSKPEDFKHVYKQTEYVTQEQLEKISANITDDDTYKSFMEYMQVRTFSQIKASDFQKAMTYLESGK